MNVWSVRPGRGRKSAGGRGRQALNAAATAWAIALGCATALGQRASDSPVRVRTAEELRRAVAAAKPGARIELAAGEYAGGFSFVDLHGTAEKPIVIAAADPEHPPLFLGGGTGIQLTDPAHVELRDLVLERQTGNGLNVDDGGTFATPARHVVLHGLRVRDVGPAGNCDGIKLSGVVDFRVEDCTVERWGSGGSAIDMVGCQRGSIERCAFRHSAEASNANGVQLKGGTRDVAVRRSRFEHAGGRAVNVGGSTGLEYFRPPLAEWTGPRFEAKDIRVEGNTIVGGDAPVAFVGVDGAVFRFNTLYLPERWALRILQENRERDFVPCRDVEVADNLVVFRSEHWSEGGVNCGDATEPKTFRFARNAWFCSDAPERTRAAVKLPASEIDGVYGVDPKFKDAAAGDLSPSRR